MSYMPQEISVESAGNDVTYDLPVRPIGKARLFGILPVAFGVLFLSMPLKQELNLLGNLLKGNANVFDLFQVLFFIPFLVGGIIPIAFGLLLMFGTCRIRWQDNKLTVYERVGPFFWSRRFASQSIRKLKVSVGTSSNGEPVKSGPLASMGTIMAEMDKKKQIVVAFYPSEWLHPLAQDLSRRMAAFSPSEAPKVELVDARAPERAAQTARKPAQSLVQISKNSGGFDMAIPAQGFAGQNRAFLVVGLLWCALMCAFTVGIFFATRNKMPDTIVWCFFAVFWAIGLSLVVSAINKSREQVSICVRNGKVVVTRTGLFGVKHWEWSLRDLKKICVDRSGVEINNKQMLELQFHPVTGKKTGICGGRDEEELKWMAEELRNALVLPPS